MRISRVVGLWLTVLWVVALGHAQTVTVNDLAARTYTAPNNDIVPYRLYTPKNYDPARKYPVVLFLHGAGERGNDNISQISGQPAVLQLIRDDTPAFFVAPQCPDNQQWVNSGPGYLSYNSTAIPISQPLSDTFSLLDSLETQYSIDPTRRYVTGLSIGGFGAWDAVIRRPGTFAATVPICGAGDPAKGVLFTDTAVWAFHSADDGTVSVAGSRNMIAAIRAAGGTPLYTEYTNAGHFSWIPAYGTPALAPWLYSQSLSPANSVPEPSVGWVLGIFAGVLGLQIVRVRRRSALTRL